MPEGLPWAAQSAGRLWGESLPQCLRQACACCCEAWGGAAGGGERSRAPSHEARGVGAPIRLGAHGVRDGVAPGGEGARRRSLIAIGDEHSEALQCQEGGECGEGGLRAAVDAGCAACPAKAGRRAVRATVACVGSSTTRRRRNSLGQQAVGDAYEHQHHGGDGKDLAGVELLEGEQKFHRSSPRRDVVRVPEQPWSAHRDSGVPARGGELPPGARCSNDLLAYNEFMAIAEPQSGRCAWPQR